MTRDNDSHGEGDRQEQRDTEVTVTETPPRERQGPGHRPRMERGGKRTRETEAEAGIRRRAQRLSAEDDRWQVGTQFRWTMIHTGKGCGEWVRERHEATLKDTDGGAVGGGGTG